MVENEGLFKNLTVIFVFLELVCTLLCFFYCQCRIRKKKMCHEQCDLETLLGEDCNLVYTDTCLHGHGIFVH
jgi:hypothetical protein